MGSWGHMLNFSRHGQSALQMAWQGCFPIGSTCGSPFAWSSLTFSYSLQALWVSGMGVECHLVICSSVTPGAGMHLFTTGLCSGFPFCQVAANHLTHFQNLLSLICRFSIILRTFWMSIYSGFFKEKTSPSLLTCLL